MVENKLHERFPQYPKIVSLSNMQVHLSKKEVRRRLDQVDEISQACTDSRQTKRVAYAFPFSNIPQFVPEPIRTMAINGYCP